jgi:hypothetical protein
MAFRRLLKFQRPATKDADIPHRTTVAKAVHAKAHKVKDILKDLFVVSHRGAVFLHYSLLPVLELTCPHESIPGEVSATLDGWSSPARDPYLGVTVHWVHSTQESPTEWSLRTLLLAFREVKGNHRGENLAKVVMEILKAAGLMSKVCAIS